MLEMLSHILRKIQDL